MALVAANVDVGVTGEVFLAPTGTAVPADGTTALAAAYKGLGYNTEEGITESIDESTTEIKAWQAGATVRVIKTSFTVKYSFSMLETNAETLKAYYGNFSPTGGVVEVRGDTGTRGVWAIDVVDGTKKVRIVIPDGEVTNRGQVQYVNGDAVAYQIEITAYPVAGVNSTKYYGTRA